MMAPSNNHMIDAARLPRFTRVMALAGSCLVASAIVHAQAAGDDNPDKTREELNAVNTDLEAQREKLREIEADIATLKNDRAKINAQLIATAERIKRYETAILQTENRLATALA